MNKTCTKCKIEKAIEEFNKSRASSDGHFYQCKECCRKISSVYYHKHRNILIKRNRKYWKSYYEKNREAVNRRNQEQYKLHKEQWKPTRKKYRISHKQYLYQKARERLKNPDVRRRKNKKQAARDRIRRETDINYKIKKNLRCRIWNALKGFYKTAHTTELLGCSVEDFKSHLQSKFQAGMSFDNYGEWHIDHIIPCDSFDLSSGDEQKKCFHFSNLQPLWRIDNLVKNNKII